MTHIARAAFLFFLTLTASAQALEYGEPAAAGLIPDRLDRIDREIIESIDAGEIAGAVALIARNGKIVYHKSFGYADIESKTAMRNDSIFRIASMTKAITSVGVMMLHEQGRFRLIDPISRFIPEFKEPRVIMVNDAGEVTGTRPAKGKVRIVDLLTHTSGISYGFNPGPLVKTYQETGIVDGMTATNVKLGPTIKKLAGLPLLFDPGSAFAYGLNTDVLGYLIEVVSGQPLDQFFEEQIFKPLGMDDTYFYLPAAKANRLVTLYAHVKGRDLAVSKGVEGDIKLDNPNYPVEGARSYFSGGAGLSSTAFDYARFTQMLLNDGELDGVRLLGRKSVELMRTARIDWDADGHADFGLGFQVVGDLGKASELGSSGAYSWGGAFYTSYWIDPAENLIGIFMSQVRPRQSNIREKFNTLVYQALE